MKSVLFNILGSKKNGTGHIYRALSLAKEINLNYTDKEYKYENFLGLNYTFSNLKRKLLKNIVKGKKDESN